MVFTNGSTLVSFNKNTARAAGGIALLLKIGDVAFSSVKFHLVRLQNKKPNQVRDI